VPPQQPYAIEVAPNTYVIRHPEAMRDDARVICVQDCAKRARHRSRRHLAGREAAKSDRPHKPADRALIEELRQRHQVKHRVADSIKVVRELPVVIVHRHVVDDPPRVIEHDHVVEDAPQSGHRLYRPREVAVIDPPLPSPPDPAPIQRAKMSKRSRVEADQKRVIHAEAEITILGPDRMSIRLYRKKSGGDADAREQ
jgi:hypothetical protein